MKYPYFKKDSSEGSEYKNTGIIWAKCPLQCYHANSENYWYSWVYHMQSLLSTSHWAMSRAYHCKNSGNSTPTWRLLLFRLSMALRSGRKAGGRWCQVIIIVL